MSDRLTELRSQVEAKQKEAEAILSKGDYAPGDMDRAEKLAGEVQDICRLIDEHNANVKKAADLKAGLSRTRDDLDRPNRTLPFEGKSAERWAATAKGETKSEVDKIAGKGGFTSLGHFAGAVRLRGRDGNGGGSAVDQLRRWETAAPSLAVKAMEEYEELGFKAPLGMYETSGCGRRTRARSSAT
jgi:hypothetical protein